MTNLTVGSPDSLPAADELNEIAGAIAFSMLDAGSPYDRVRALIAFRQAREYVETYDTPGWAIIALLWWMDITHPVINDFVQRGEDQRARELVVRVHKHLVRCFPPTLVS